MKAFSLQAAANEANPNTETTLAENNVPGEDIAAQTKNPEHATKCPKFFKDKHKNIAPREANTKTASSSNGSFKEARTWCKENIGTPFKNFFTNLARIVIFYLILHILREYAPDLEPVITPLIDLMEVIVVGILNFFTKIFSLINELIDMVATDAQNGKWFATLLKNLTQFFFG